MCIRDRLSVLGLVARGLGKAIRDLNVAVLLGLGCIVAILGMCLRLAGKSGLAISLEELCSRPA